MRKTYAERKNEVLKAAFELAKKKNYLKITRENIAKKLKCTPQLISYYYDIKGIRKEVVIEALAQNHKSILAQALVNGEPLVKKLPLDVKEELLKHYLT
jgi:AcrR family transcriptional regulator